MKLSQYAKLKSISYKTAHRHWKAGLIKGEQLSTGTIVVYSNEDVKQKEHNETQVIQKLVSVVNYLSKELYGKNNGEEIAKKIINEVESKK